ncbi:protein takeout-like [Zootermopsis nevadensis]|uniref:protein takeout-like n=1 Tax=Zootermopsis nevadensis TaxID=136037 RepID=UPI000B8E374A|nr:protein takeout-like [Zootermopsis nevadensis]
MFQFVLVALLASTTVAAPPASVEWPDIFEPCPRNSPDFEGCATRNIQRALVKFSAGVPALGVPPLDPLFAPEVLLNYKRGDAVGNMVVKNTNFYGLKDIEILDFRANLSDSSNLVFDIDYRLPTALAEGEYKAQGKIVGFTFGGKGVYNISMSDVTATCGVRGDLVTIDGEQYLKVRHVTVYPEVGDMKLYISNFFNDSDELNEAALQFVNLYWRPLYKELLPYAAEGWDQYLRGLFNKMLLRVPFRILFPEN